MPRVGEPGIHRGGDRADTELQEADLRSASSSSFSDERAAEHVGVAAEVLGGRVHDHVGAERERLLQVRRGEGVVDDDEHAGRVADLGERGDVA